MKTTRKANRFTWQPGDLTRTQPQSSLIASVMREITLAMPQTAEPYSVGRRAGLSLALGLLANHYLILLKVERKGKGV